MRFRTALSILFAGMACVGLNAQTVSSAHQRAHRQQLANHSSGIELRAVEEMIEEDIISREKNISPEASRLIEDLLKEARTHIGKKYVHATHGPNTFDCSGFSSYVYKQFGYDVSQAVRKQYAQGVKVERKDARRGDLIFFTSRSSGSNVGHVGIITDIDKTTGEISFIHASLSGVKISKVEGYYANRYVGIKRVIE